MAKKELSVAVSGPDVHAQRPAPFCSQPWTTLYVQWDGKVTRPCIRGPQNLGDLADVNDIEAFWNGASLAAVRRSIATEKGLNVACQGCFAMRSRTIDHITPFGRNIGGDFRYEKVANFYDVVDAHRAGHESTSGRPIVLIMDLSSKCHIRCPKCFVYNSDMQYGLGHMPRRVFDKVKPLFRTALEVIGHENGECMLHKQFFEMVAEIKGAGCRFMFNTTGQLIDEAKAAQLVDLRVDKIMFSIDSVEPETYSRLQKGGTFEKLMAGITAINEAKSRAGSMYPRLGWYFVASQSNVDQLPRAAAMARELGFKMMYVGQLNKPTGEQWRTYFDFYRMEGLFSSNDLGRYEDAVGKAKVIAASAGMEFFSGSADA